MNNKETKSQPDRQARLPAGRQGFTLIEILIVIAIMGILASMVLFALHRTREKALDARIKSSISQLRIIGEDIADSKDAEYTDVQACFMTDNPNASTFVCHGNGELVATLKNDIALVSEAPITAKSAAGAFCVQTPLKSNSAQRFCVDNSGGARAVTEDCTDTGVCPNP